MTSAVHGWDRDVSRHVGGVERAGIMNSVYGSFVPRNYYLIPV